MISNCNFAAGAHGRIEERRLPGKPVAALT